MDPRFQSSFIPKKPGAMNMGPKRGPINLLSLISTVIFIVIIAGAIAVFFYQNYLNGAIASDKQSLNLTQGEFDPATINQIIRLDSRLNMGSTLLSGHVAVSNLFTALENLTLQTVRFKDFNFITGDQSSITLTMSGEAQSFSDVALQSAAFNSSPYFKNLVTSDLSVEQSGLVAFDMTMTVDPSLVGYEPPAGTASQPASAATSSPSTPAATSPVATTSTASAATSSVKTTNP